MRVTITARHCNLTRELRDRIDTVMDRLGQRTPFAQGATVVLDESAGQGHDGSPIPAFRRHRVGGCQ